MRHRLVDVRNLDELSNALLQILFFSEHVNVQSSSWISRYRDSLEPQGKTQLLQLKVALQKAEQSFPRALRHPRTPHSELILLAKRVGLRPELNPRLIGALVDSILRPPKAGAEQRLMAPQRLTESVFVYPLPGGGSSFATRSVLGKERIQKSIPLLFWDEALNPISMLQAFLLDVLKEDIYSADHYIQTWLKHVFSLSYEKDLKYTLTSVCGLFNEIFYGSLNPSHQQFHTKKSATVGVSLLVFEVARILMKGTMGESVSSGSIDDLSLRRALGIFLFFRFCRQLRCRYQRLDLQVDGEGKPESESFSILRATVDRGQCVSALRPLQSTYFQTRMFGVLSAIPGFNEVFRGGLLPRTSSGRTFTVVGGFGVGKTVLALQMMSDMARQGWLAVYFSFEESYELIMDRLVTFRLYDPEKYDVVDAGPDLASRIREAFHASPRRGLLVLYSKESSSDEEHTDEEKADQEYTYSLPAAIKEIANAAEDWNWRALVIDSINALDFSSTSEGFSRRVKLQSLVRLIENQRFFGVILTEQGNPDFDVLAYLSDTTVELGIDEESRTRWLRVKKSRGQDYHPGNHLFRIGDGHGVVIYPSSSARMSSLRRRMRTTLSERRTIPFPPNWAKQLAFPGLQEKSSTLIRGAAGAGKTVLMMQLATTTSRDYSELQSTSSKQGRISARFSKKRGVKPEPLANVLMVTFRTSELNVLQSLQHHEGLYGRWTSIPRTRLRWYSPGDNMTAEQIISELLSYIQESRRDGLPIERILFDETEVAEEFLPALKREPLFWPTLLEMVATEAITSFFVAGSDHKGSRVVEWLGSTVDYILHVYRDELGHHWAEVEKSPALWMAGPSRKVEMLLNPETGMIE